MPLNLGALRAVADRLDPLGIAYAFVGGAVVNLLLDRPDFAPARGTDDVDVIIEIVAGERYSDFEARLREHEFDHDMSEGAPRCRWVLGDLKVDVMPTDGAHLGLNTAWFREGLATATEQEFHHQKVKLVSPVAFLVTKIVAFEDRGQKDYFGSQDFEDIVTVIDGRARIGEEIDASPAELRRVVIQAIRRMRAERNFDDALVGNLGMDAASEARLPLLREKLRRIGELPV